MMFMNMNCRRALIYIIMCVLAISMFAQSPSASSKMSRMVREAARSDMKMRRAKGTGSKQHICAFVKIEGDGEKVLRDNGSKVLAQWGNIYIADIPVNRLCTLAQCAGVHRIEASEPCSVTVDVAAEKLGADNVRSGMGLPQGYDGTGVVVGVMDVGFDLTHPTYYSKDMKEYRIKRFWDQLSRDTLDSELFVGRDYKGKDELLRLQHSYDGMQETHGTHTSSTAAGSGAEGNGVVSPYIGMAPGADICLVANAVSSNINLVDSLQQYKFTSASNALGFKYIFDYAESVGKPCVISFSEGRHQDMYDEDILYYAVLDSITGPGRIIAAAAGNEGYQNTYMHKDAGKQSAGAFVTGSKEYFFAAMRTMSSADDEKLGLRLNLYDKDGGKPFEYTISAKDVFAAQDSDYIDTLYTGTGRDYVVEMCAYPNCYDKTQTAYEFVILTLDKSTLGTGGYAVSVEMVGEGIEAELFKVSGNLVSNSKNPDLDDAVPGYSIHSPSSAPCVISVGLTGYREGVTNYRGEWKQSSTARNGERNTMSGIGPTLTGLIKPDVMAPGTNLIAAYNSFYLETHPSAGDITWDVRHFEYQGRTYPWNANSGTSMACPLAAGVIALWLQAKPDLSPEEAMEVIAATSFHYEEDADYPNNYYGYGQIDAYRGMKYIQETLIPRSIGKTEMDGKADSKWYNLQGQAVDDSYRGIVIMNGKKVWRR